MYDYQIRLAGHGRDGPLLAAQPHPQQPQSLLWTLPRELGTGTFVAHPLSCHTSITVSDCHHVKRLHARLVDNRDYCSLVFCLRGASYQQNSCFEQGFALESGENCLYASDDPSLIREIGAKEKLHTIVIRMPRSRLDCLPARESYCFTHRTSLRMKCILERIVHCCRQGAARRFFLESQALELVALKLETVFEQQAPQSLPAQDYLAVMRVKEFLLQNLHAPPAMQHLCRIAGMSHPKLNKCFKQLFGSTVFAWLRQQRLQLSQHLITANEMNLTAIAYALGFANSSHFSREFIKYYGIPPSRYKETIE
jgi:AraC-like DNA-binding protein